MKNKIFLFASAAAAIMMVSSCQKMDRPELGNYAKDANPPGGPLKFYTAFDGTDVDSIRANFALENPLTYVAGINKQALKGADGKAASWPSANDFKNSTSFSISYWIKNNAQPGRTEFLFSLVDTKSGYWHNSSLFLLLENQTATKTTMKLGVMDHWLEGDFNKPMFDGNWHHIVYSYDQTTSKMTYYFDGVVVTGLTSTQTDLKNGSAPFGAVNFTNSDKFIIGGWNKHANATGPTDGWISSYTGAVDQFRLYGKALTAAEVTALFNGKM